MTIAPARRARPTILALCTAVLVSAAVPMPMQGGMSAADRSDLARVSSALNAIHSLEGNFVQLGPEGQVDQGRFYIEKPGRMRFEYARPNPTLVVSDGRWVAVENRQLKTMDRYALWTTPLDLILGNDIDLPDNSEIVGVEHTGGELVVRARSHTGQVNGNIALEFSEPGLVLTQWTVVDAQGLLTTVSITNVKNDVTLDPDLFVIPKQPDSAQNSAH